MLVSGEGYFIVRISKPKDYEVGDEKKRRKETGVRAGAERALEGPRPA